jgi:hypothetical protein
VELGGQPVTGGWIGEVCFTAPLRACLRLMAYAAVALVAFVLGCWCGEREARPARAITFEECELAGEISAVKRQVERMDLQQQELLRRKTLKMREDQR